MPRPTKSKGLNTMATTPTPAPDYKVTKKIKVFSATDLKPIDKEFSFECVPAADVQSALARIPGDEIAQKRLLNMLNSTLEYFAGRDARKDAVGDAISRKTIFTLIKGFRELPMFSLPEVPKPTAEQKRAQTEGILNSIRENPAMLSYVVSAAAGSTEDDGDETEETEG